MEQNINDRVTEELKKDGRRIRLSSEARERILSKGLPASTPEKKTFLSRKTVILLAATISVLLIAALTAAFILLNKTPGTQEASPTQNGAGETAAKSAEEDGTQTDTTREASEQTSATTADPTDTETETPGYSGNYPLYFSSADPRSMLLNNDTVAPDPDWGRVIMRFAVITVTEKTDEKATIGGVEYFKACCNCVWGYGGLEVTTPYGQAPQVIKGDGDYRNYVSMEEALTFYPFVYLSGRTLDGIQTDDTIIVSLDYDFDQRCMYSRDDAETRLAQLAERYKEHPDMNYEGARNKIIEECYDRMLYIPVIDGKLVYNGKLAQQYENCLSTLRTLLDKTQRFKKSYENNGRLPDMFSPIQFYDILPDCRIKSGISIEQFKDVLTWYSSAKKEYEAYIEAYDSILQRDHKWICNPGSENAWMVRMKIGVPGGWTIARIDEITEETRTVNGTLCRKVLCSVLAGGEKEIDAFWKSTVNMKDYGCFYLCEKLIGEYEAGDSVFGVFNIVTSTEPYSFYFGNSGSSCHFKEGEMLPRSNGVNDLMNTLNLNLINIKAIRDEGYDFHNHWIGDMIDSLPETYFEEGMRVEDAVEVFDWFVRLGRRQDGLSDEKEPWEDLNIYINNDQVTATVCGIGRYKEKEVIIPSAYRGAKITAIGYGAFFNCTTITSIEIPDNVTYIGERAFAGCTGLTSLKIPESVKTIGKGAFSGCTGLTSVILPDGLTSVGERLFEGCTGLTGVILPDSVTAVETCAFLGCTGLKSVDFSDNLTSIAERAFSECPNLDFRTDGAVTYLGNPSNPYQVLIRVDSYVISYQIHEQTKVIADCAFYNSKKLESVEIPESVSAIGKSAFANCKKLTEVFLSEGLRSIGAGAFDYCKSLKKLIVPDSVEEIGDNAFRLCGGLKDLTIGKGVTRIGREAFMNCAGLTSLILPDGVRLIGEEAFRGCTALKTLTVGKGVAEIDDGAFRYCNKLTEVNYRGSAEEWSKISVGDDNKPLIKARIEFDFTE